MGIGIAGSVLCTWLLRMLICWRLHRHEKRHGTGFPVRLLQAVNGTFWSIVGCIAAFLFMLPVLNALPFDIYPFEYAYFEDKDENRWYVEFIWTGQYSIMFQDGVDYEVTITTSRLLIGDYLFERQ